MARAPDCLASHACVPDSNPAIPVWGFPRKGLDQCIDIIFAQGPALRAPHKKIIFARFLNLRMCTHHEIRENLNIVTIINTDTMHWKQHHKKYSTLTVAPSKYHTTCNLCMAKYRHNALGAAQQEVGYINSSTFQIP